MRNMLINTSPHIEGRNLILRGMVVSDANENYLHWMNDPDINQYLESRFEKTDLIKLRAYVRKTVRERRCLFLAIIRRLSGEHIGNIKIGPVVLPHRFADVGIIIGEKSYWGKGLASEAIRLAKDYAFRKLKINKLTAGAYSNNIGSIRAFKKSGFSVEGVRKKQYLYNGGYVDAVILGCKNNFRSSKNGKN